MRESAAEGTPSMNVLFDSLEPRLMLSTQSLEGASAAFVPPHGADMLMDVLTAASSDNSGDGISYTRFLKKVPAGWDGKGQHAAALNYYFDSSFPDKYKADIIRAMNTWASFVQVTFTEVDKPAQPRTIDFSFAAIDGRDQTLAYSYFPIPVNKDPIAGDVCFDTAENWNSNYLYEVALHEIGHSLGLPHSKDNSAVMAPYYDGSDELTWDDIDRIRKVYASISDGFEPNNTRATAADIEPGVEQTRIFQSENDPDWFKFTLTQRAKVEISALAEWEGLEGGLQWYISPPGAIGYLSSDYGTGQTSVLDPGTYYLSVEAEPVSSYTISMNILPERDAFEAPNNGSYGATGADDTCTTATAISTLCEAQVHSIHVPSDQDWVKFTTYATTPVTVRAVGPTPGSVKTELFAADGTTLLAQDVGSGPDGISQILLDGDSAIPAGDYYVRATSAQSGQTVSSYSLSVDTPDSAIMSVDDISVVEGDAGTTDAVFAVKLSRQVSCTVTASYKAFVDSCQTDDFIPLEGTLTFAPGQTSILVTLHVVGDTMFGPDETVSLGISNTTNSGPVPDVNGYQAVAHCRIDNDDPMPTVILPQLSIDEGRVSWWEMPVLLSGPMETSTSILFDTPFSTYNSQVFFKAGQTAGTLRVYIDGDHAPWLDQTLIIGYWPMGESEEYVQLNVQADASKPRVYINVVKDHGCQLDKDDFVYFDVTTYFADSQTLKVFWYATSDDAIAGIDYADASGVLVFPPGVTRQTIKVAVNGRNKKEGLGFRVVIDCLGAECYSPFSSAEIPYAHHRNVIAPPEGQSFVWSGPDQGLWEFDLKGPGTMNGWVENDCMFHLTLDDVTLDSAFSVKELRHGSYPPWLREVVVNGSIGKLLISGIALEGSLKITGAVERLALGTDGYLTIQIDADHSAVGAAPMVFSAKCANDFTLDTGNVPVKSITLINSNAYATADDGCQIICPSIETLTCKGDLWGTISTTQGGIGTIAVAGWMDGCTIASQGDIGSIVTRGMRHAEISTTQGGIGKVTVPGWMDSCTIASQGDIGSIVTRGVRDTTIVVGSSDTARWIYPFDLPPADCIAHRIESFVVRGGIKGEQYCTQDLTLVAGSMGTIDLGTIQFDSDFGTGLIGCVPAVLKCTWQGKRYTWPKWPEAAIQPGAAFWLQLEATVLSS